MPMGISHEKPARLAMQVILGIVGALVSFMTSVITPRHLRRRDPSDQKPTLGSISGSWLAEYDAKERQGGS